SPAGETSTYPYPAGPRVSLHSLPTSANGFSNSVAVTVFSPGGVAWDGHAVTAVMPPAARTAAVLAQIRRFFIVCGSFVVGHRSAEDRAHRCPRKAATRQAAVGGQVGSLPPLSCARQVMQ